MGDRAQDENDLWQRATKITGKIDRAKGLYMAADCFVVVKGIRASSNLVDIFVSPIERETMTPQWDEEFEFECPASWGVVVLVGLKFLVFAKGRYDTFTSSMGTDLFMGGADVDIAEIKSNELMKRELDLGGIPVNAAGTGKVVKSRLFVEFTIHKEMEPKPKLAAVVLTRSMLSLNRTLEVKGALHKLKNLSFSYAQVIVRVMMINGDVRIVHKSKVIDSPEEIFNEPIRFYFQKNQEVALLSCDVFEVSSQTGEDALKTGKHLGTAVINIFDLPETKKKLKLILQTTSFERRLDAYGNPLDPQLEAAARAEASKSEEEEEEPGSQSPLGRRSMGFSGRFSMMSRVTTSGTDLDDESSPGPPSRLVRFKRMLGWKEATAEKEEKVVDLRPVVSMTLRVCRSEESMPFAKEYQTPHLISGEEDLAEMKLMDDWERSAFGVPAQLLGPRPPRGCLCSDDRLLFISGVMRGSMSLPYLEDFGKPVAYAVVEGVSRKDTKVFLHRTRPVAGKASPTWDEPFFFRIAEDQEVVRLIISVYDANKQGSDSASDEFMGRATLDLLNVPNGVKVWEDIPLSGATGRAQEAYKQARREEARAIGGFRRLPYVSLEARVERRLKPYYDMSALQDKPTPVRLHTQSRDFTSVRTYEGVAWQDSLQQPVEAADISGAVLVTHLRTNGKLTSAAMRGRQLQGWLEIPGQQEAEVDPFAETPTGGNRQMFGRTPDEERACDYTYIGLAKELVLSKSTSLPMLSTRFRPGYNPLASQIDGQLSQGQIAEFHEGNAILKTLVANVGKKPHPAIALKRIPHEGRRIL